ncbi:hypothetical protein [Myxococcus xanthus]|uniref:Alginate export domain-containing protein n=1 Tax=Myxococcus xanthus TaxID=34 RepID=A0A7Y4IE27_MYXXA|nr:hypothetical protein [Myxococcus xanthus]NOJ76975.1 hypothetical protein [Myxococcus xanthus]NOJ84580.1 hypothetical protein [Myxococcus xanthus]
MTLRRPLSVLSLSLCLGFSAPAAAEEPEAAALPSTPQTAPKPTDAPTAPTLPPLGPDTRLYFANINFLRWNPLGMETQNRLVLQKRMFDGESMLTRDNFVNGAFAIKANPASVKIGPVFEIQPLAIFNLRATYEYVRYFGTFGFLQSYNNPMLDFSDDARDLTEDAAYSTSGHHYMVEPTLQARFGSFVVRSKASIEYWNVALREGNGASFYDALLDTLIPGRGWVFTNDTDLMMLTTPQLTLGARFSGVWPRYQDGSGGAQNVDNGHTRIGPMLAYALNTREGSSFNRPTILLNFAWYLNHPNRGGALPYMMGAFAFTSDFLGG